MTAAARNLTGGPGNERFDAMTTMQLVGLDAVPENYVLNSDAQAPSENVVPFQVKQKTPRQAPSTHVLSRKP